jgi:hypothetical protein
MIGDDASVSASVSGVMSFFTCLAMIGTSVCTGASSLSVIATVWSFSISMLRIVVFGLLSDD